MMVDAFELAQSGQHMSGTIAVAALRRIDVMQRSGELAWSLTGGIDRRRRAVLDLSVSGHLVLECQRCLEPMQFEVHIANRLVLVRTDAEADAEPIDDDETDVIVAPQGLDVDALVEDEVLLSLPLVPKHQSCNPGRGMEVGKDDLAEPDDKQGAGIRPFAGLAQLKGRRSQ
jgi:uncharacterized protein